MLSDKTHNQTRLNSFMSVTPISRAVLQRKCACGTHTMGGEQCAECQKKNMAVDGRPLQTKLRISEPGEVHEQEADRVAEQVMRISQADVSARLGESPDQPMVQRLASSGGMGLAEAPAIVNDVLNSSGQPLDSSARAFFEPRFGHDFSQVRIHTGAKAAESARAVDALAYTVEQDVVFGAERYLPMTTQGRKLLAHELTHVFQQSNPTGIPQPKSSITASDGISQRQATVFTERIAGQSTSPPILRELKASDHHRAMAPSIQRTIASTSTTPTVDPQRVAELRSLIAQYQALLRSGALSVEEVVEVDEAIARAETALQEAARVSGAGSSLRSAAGVALGATAVLAADDVTGVGVADDVAIPFTLLAAGALALGAMILSRSPRDIQRTGEAARDAVAEAIRTIGQIVLAQRIGDQVRGLTTQIVIHLARILGTTVSGQPPDHQQDPERDRPHWWTEIKNWLRQIQDKGLTPRQLLRELRRRFSDEQLAEIREAIREAARRMGEDPPDFPPTAMP